MGMSCGAKERDFSFWMPVGLVSKAGETPRIGGIASDETAKDLQGEKVLIDGLDISYLTQRGTFNWDHGKEPGDIIGEIDTAKKMVGDNKQLYVEGFLYPKVKKAQEVLELLDSLKEANSERKLGLSLEGKIRERDGVDGKIVKKAWIRNVAVTYHPINQGTWIDFIKSLGDNPTYEKCTICDFDCPADCPEHEAKCEEVTKSEEPKEVEPEPKKVEEVTKSEEPKKEDNRQDSVLASGEIVEKADPGVSPPGVGLSAGHDNPASSGGISGSALRVQSLEGAKKVTTYDKKKKKIKKSDIIESLVKRGWDAKRASLVADFLFKATELVSLDEFGKSKGPWKYHHGKSIHENLKSASKRGLIKPGLKMGPTKWKEHLLGLSKSGVYTKSDIVTLLKSKRGYSDSLAEKMADFIFKAVEVAGYTRTRKGHLERVGTHTRMSSAIAHELMRIGTMSDRALATRAGKIGHPDKILHFYAALKEAGKDEIAGVVRMQGRKIGLKDSDFDQVRTHTKPFIEERMEATAA